MSSNDNSSGQPLFAPTGNDNIAELPFYILTWVFFALCIIAFAVRVYIRFVCFRKFVLEDYLMLIALLMHSAEAILIQLFVGYMYDVEAVEKGDFSVVGPDFFPNSKKGFVGLGTSVNLTIIGVLIVKINFLIFFKRLGAHIRKFNIAWWCVLVFTVAGAITQIGMQTFGCFFGSTDYIFSPNCAAEPALTRIFINAIYSAVIDAVSDILIVCFPVWILWGSGISLRKKIALTFVFSLVWLTIAITIVRGSIFHQQYSMAASGEAATMQSATFTWFWFYMEFSVAFLIACLVSFRSLFVQRAKKESQPRQERAWQEAAYRSAMRRAQLRKEKGLMGKWHALQDTMLDKFKTLEGWTGSDAETLHGGKGALPSVPSGLMTVDFQDDTNWMKNRSAAGVRTVSSVEPPAAISEEESPLYQYQASPPYEPYEQQGPQQQQQQQQQQPPQFQPPRYYHQPQQPQQAQYQSYQSYHKDQYQYQYQSQNSVPTGSVHSQETLLQDLEPVHLKPVTSVGVAK
ncbi:hypothetical protein B0J18DRAFT_387754 [Chaetomium sp. MPI-SDFR-AT-0129]|nr:hypothetical protein B0J18DRAFT_387754 [Chaetomium sp. MPI-SDFR-AT-0129]